MARILVEFPLAERHSFLAGVLSKFLDVCEDETERFLSLACEELAAEKFF